MRGLILPVYGQHLKQILRTTGGLIVAEQGAVCAVGTADHSAAAADLAARLLHHRRRCDVEIPPAGDAGRRCRVPRHSTGNLNRTKIGLLDPRRRRDREMVGSAGVSHPPAVPRVFMTGSALAGLGCTMWALYREQVHASMGDELTVLVFIVVIIGGLGSIGGCFIGALLVADGRQLRRLPGPKAGAGLNILLMVAILMWRPRGALCGDKSMMRLSGDPPRSQPALSILLIVIIAALACGGRSCFLPAPRR